MTPLFEGSKRQLQLRHYLCQVTTVLFVRLSTSWMRGFCKQNYKSFILGQAFA